jgi:hypothetical protein
MNFSFWRRSASGEKSHKKKNSAEYFSFGARVITLAPSQPHIFFEQADQSFFY